MNTNESWDVVQALTKYMSAHDLEEILTVALGEPLQQNLATRAVWLMRWQNGFPEFWGALGHASQNRLIAAAVGAYGYSSMLERVERCEGQAPTPRA